MLKSAKLREQRLELSILAVLALIFLLFVIGNPRVFLGFDIYYSFMSTIPFTGILALALTLVVTLGEMDLSFPSVLAFSAWVFGTVFTLSGSMILAVLCCLSVGLVAGFLNSILIVHIRIPSLVATIGTMFFFRGLVNVCAQGRGITLVTTQGTFLYQLFVGRIKGLIPAQAVWMLAVGLFFWLLLNRHRIGTHILFVGDNVESSRMMGINVGRVRTLVFMQMGFFAAFAGILSTLEVTYFWPSLGQGYLLTALAAVFVGGTSVFGGMGTVVGTFIGALIIGSLEAGIIAIGLTGFWIQLIYGLIIMISVSIYAVLLRRSA
jgi:simple sugar transport system permease protein